MSTERDCPLCGHGGTELRLSFPSAELANKWGRLNIDISGELASVQLIELWRCDRCGLQYFLPRTLVGPPSLYVALEKFDWYYLQEKWEHRQALGELADTDRGLEIGSGFGAFVELASKVCPTFQGCDQNPSALQVASLRGLNVKNIDLQALTSSDPASYDVVCAFQVLEHVASPGEFLRLCCALLKPGGKLILSLPNAESYLRYQDNVLDLPPHHMTRWNPTVMTAIPRFFPLLLKTLAYEPLPTEQITSYAQAHTSRLAHLRPFRSRRWRKLVELPLHIERVRRHLQGQNLYAVYQRQSSP